MKTTKTTGRIAAVLAVIALLLTAGAGIASAQSDTRLFLVGTGLLCDLDPAACPAITSSATGDTIEIAGAGTLNEASGRVEGGGSFVHRDPSGAVVASGVWVVEEVLGFRSYGDGTPQGQPEEFEGGLARLRVRLFPSTGEAGLDAVLIIDCLLGDPPGEAAEGVTLRVEGGPNFDTIVSGFTLFIRQH